MRKFLFECGKNGIGYAPAAGGFMNDHEQVIGMGVTSE
jgi:hypothetical protein